MRSPPIVPAINAMIIISPQNRAPCMFPWTKFQIRPTTPGMKSIVANPRNFVIMFWSVCSQINSDPASLAVEFCIIFFSRKEKLCASATSKPHIPKMVCDCEAARWQVHKQNKWWQKWRTSSRNGASRLRPAWMRFRRTAILTVRLFTARRAATESPLWHSG